ncbi:formate dehydrogenase subunit gamma [Oxalobacteraceae bacterium OM1]|nr:formate dehydrogenase subunit gamma [Oxalobacteraceae bacterium OM1]
MRDRNPFPPSLIRLLLQWLAAFMLMSLVPTLQAAVPNESAKPAYAEEQTVLQTEKDQPEPGFGSAKSGRTHFDRHFIIPPGFMPEQDLILQRGGNTWRLLRNGPFATFAGIVLLVVPLLIFGFYQAVGPARLQVPETGRQITRFSAWDRLVHWSTAIAFIVMAITGVIILFGKKLLLPWMGHDIFSWFAVISKTLHNFVGPLFIVASLIMFFTYLRRNVFQNYDWHWIKRGGGLASHEHVPAGYFNAGEKVWFWLGVTGLGLLMSVTGLMLDFPYFKNIGENLGITRYLLQIADYLHLLGATFYIAAAMGHIYIGTWGTPGAYHAMRHGTVDEAWARSHHELWYNDLASGGHDTPPLPPGATTYPPRA